MSVRRLTSARAVDSETHVARAVEAQGALGVVLPWRALAIARSLMLAALGALHWGCLALIGKDDLEPGLGPGFRGLMSGSPGSW
jgi:hypothetical protein